MRTLAIDAATVPVVYRIRVTGPDGQVASTTAHTCLPSEIDAAVERVRVAFDQLDHCTWTVEHWEA